MGVNSSATGPGGTRIGVCVRFKNPPKFHRPWSQVYREHLDYAAAADRLGFDGIWVPEHHCVPSGYNPAPFTALSAIAQVAPRVAIGTQPLLLPLHNPVLAAEEAAVLDAISDGRFILGVAAGYRTGDFEALGLDRRERGARTDECLDILLKALRARVSFDFDGRFYKLRNVEIFPKPLSSSSIEVQLAVRSEAAARRAARQAVSVNLLAAAPAEVYGPIVAAEVDRAGRDPREVGATVLRTGFLTTSPQAADALVRPYAEVDAAEYDAWQDTDPDDKRLVAQRRATVSPVGAATPQALVDALEADIALMSRVGLRPAWVNLNLWPPGMPLDQAMDCLERVARDVLPKVSRTAAVAA